MKSRRYFLTQGAMAATALAFGKNIPFSGLKSTAPATATGEGSSLTILHTNDFHNHIVPHSHLHFSNMGGFEKASQVISRIKNETRNVLLVDAGDIFSGDLTDERKHASILRRMNFLEYDATLPGNRDYEAGADYLQSQWQKSRLPLVSSNYVFKSSTLGNFHEAYKILQKGNIKIGVIGAGVNLKGLTPSGLSQSVRYLDPLIELTSLATMLKVEKKCQLVVCLSHLGFRNKNNMDDLRLAELSKNIDVIIGGHSHTFMQTPHIVINQLNQEVIVNHAGYGGIALGNMNFSFDFEGNKQMVSFKNQLIGGGESGWKTPVPQVWGAAPAVRDRDGAS